jgi:hypothetical protein
MNKIYFNLRNEKYKFRQKYVYILIMIFEIISLIKKF